MNKPNFRPKIEFHRHDEIKRELVKVVDASNFNFCVSFALAEFCFVTNPTPDQLAAVKTFISIFMNLPHDDPSPPEFPVHRLDHTVYEPTKQTTQKE